MTSIRVVIADDEPLARRTLRDLLLRDPECAIVAEVGAGGAALGAIADHDPDVVFLDIEMPGMHGLQVVERLPGDRRPHIVFVTAYHEFAIRAFEVDALDYVLKPFDDRRIATAWTRAKTRIRARTDRAPDPASPHDASVPTPSDHPRNDAGYLERFAIPGGRGDVTFVDARDVEWIEAANYYARLHGGNRTHLVRMSMTRLETQLDPRRFIRVHRSAIVRIDRIARIERDTRGDDRVVLKDGTVVRMSRRRRRVVGRVVG